MNTNIKTTNKLTMISEMTKDSKFQILEFDKIDGGKDIDIALEAQKINEKHIKLRQIRIILEDSVLYIQNDKVSYFVGDITVKNKKSKSMSLSKKLFMGKLLEEYEDTIKPIYEGTGEIFLKPDFKNYALIELQDEEVIIYEENYIASESSLDLEPLSENEKAGFRVSGSGILALELPVPDCEIFKCKLNNNSLKINGDLVVLHQGEVEFTAEENNDYIDEESKGILNVYSGIGEVWVIPTKEVYDSIVYIYEGEKS